MTTANRNEYTTLRYEVSGDGVLTLWLDRPERLNAFTVTMARELVAAIDRASADHDVAAVVVTGAGKAFCAGMDLTTGGNVFGLDEDLHPTPEELRKRANEATMIDGVRDTGGMVSLAIYRCNKPVIGAINGAAVGVGATMTLPMDVRIASDRARIGFVFGRLGLVPEACSTWFLPRIVGTGQALEWVYSAEIMTADDALAGRLVREVVPPGDLLTRAHQLARQFTAGRSPVATALTRQMIYRNQASSGPFDAHLVESLAMLATSRGAGKEGIAAFLEKREPQFEDRVSTDLPAVFPDSSS